MNSPAVAPWFPGTGPDLPDFGLDDRGACPVHPDLTALEPDHRPARTIGRHGGWAVMTAALNPGVSRSPHPLVQVEHKIKLCRVLDAVGIHQGIHKNHEYQRARAAADRGPALPAVRGRAPAGIQPTRPVAGLRERGPVAQVMASRAPSGPLPSRPVRGEP